MYSKDIRRLRYLDRKDEYLEYKSKYSQEHKDEIYESNRDYYERKRLQLCELLGGVVCSNVKCLVDGGCRDSRCLQIDHKDGDGYNERKKFKGVNSMIQYYLKHPEEAREKLQVLCANCNWIKRHENKEVLLARRKRRGII